LEKSREHNLTRYKARLGYRSNWSNWISDEAWDYRDLKNVYVPIYAEITNGRYDHQCYLLALGEVTNLPDEEMAGETWNEGQEGRVASFIFVYNIRQRYPGYEKMVHKCVIHELGHARALLSHLCVGSSMSPEHDLEDCVMAQGRYAQCTGWDVTQNLHFCNMCLNNIHAVKW